MSRLINADKYMSHLRANINTTSDIIAEQIKKDKPIGTVADGGQIGYLNALQWARASLECDCYTVKAIPLDKIKQVMEQIIDEKDFAYADFNEYKREVLGVEDADDLPDDDFRFGMGRCLDILNKLIAESEEE